MAFHWRKVYIFISSTFSDMHAERDCLVKRVFPELRDWCERRRLSLMDVDLRWGVTEADATANAGVVGTCLKRIDDCRPFFICLLGQRYGWIPQREDISPETFSDYPELGETVAEGASVTELEILHAARRPFRGRQAGGRYDPAEHTFFYLREDNYLKDLPEETPLLKSIYTDETIVDPAVRKLLREKQYRLKSEIIPGTGRPIRHYQAIWDLRGNTPEIALPLKCPALLEPNVRRWQETWEQALGLNDRLTGREIPAVLRAEAEDFNKHLTAGRLGQFSVGQQPLHEVILADLKSAIAERYPEHMEIAEASDLQRELNQHEEFLFANSEGFIERKEDFRELNDYLAGDCRRLFVLTGEGGMGKSMLLANWIERCRREAGSFKDTTFHFRFIGQSDGSSTVAGLLRHLLGELKEVEGKIPETVTEIRAGPEGETDRAEVPLIIPADPHELRIFWREQLDSLGNTGRTVIVIDALDQLESGLKDLSWLPMAGLPEKVKLVVSFRTDSPEARALKERFGDNRHISLLEVTPFSAREDRRRLVEAYLSQYLKELDAEQIELLIDARGANNPLFLKVVLSELKVFGSYEQLQDKIQSDFGETPVSAFEAVLKRLETDPVYTSVRPLEGIPLLFGLLLHARYGLSVAELSNLFCENLELEPSRDGLVQEAVHLFLRQVKPFWGRREGRYGFFYHSFREAAHKRYVLEKPDHPSTAWHGLLADYFAARTLYLDAAEELGPDLRKLAELPFQQARAHRFADLQTTLTDYEFLKAKVDTLGPQPLIEDYSLSLAEGYRGRDLELVKGALSLAAHILERDKKQLPSQLTGRLLSQDNPEIQALLKQIRSYCREPWLCPLTPSLTAPGGSLIFILEAHKHSIASVAISPNGRLGVTGSADETLKVWDLEKGLEVYTLTGHEDGIEAIAITGDGAKAVSASHDHTLKVWDIEQGILLQTLEGHTAPVLTVAITPDDRQVISGSVDTTIMVWDIENGTTAGKLGYHSNPVSAVLFTENGLLVSASVDGIVKVWDTIQRQVVRTFNICKSGVFSIAMSADEKTLYTGSGDGAIQVWDLKQKTLLKTLMGHKARVTSITVIPQSQQLVSTSTDRTVRVWSFESEAEQYILGEHSLQVWDADVTPDGEYILSVSMDRTIKLWKADGNIVKPQEIVPGSAITAVKALPVSSRLLVAFNEPNLRIWDAKQQQEQFRLIGHKGGILDVAVTADGKRALSASHDRTVRVWDLEKRAELMELVGHEDSVWSVAATPDGRFAVSGSQDRTLRVWDLEKQDELHVLRGHKDWVLSVSVSQDSLYAVSASKDRTIRAWDLKHGNEIDCVVGHSDAVWSVTIIPDGSRIISGSLDGTLKIWSLAQSENSVNKHLEEDFTLKAGGWIQGVTALGDNIHVASVSLGGEIKIWNIVTRELIITFTVDESLTCVSVLPDDITFAVGGALGRLHLLCLQELFNK